MTVYIASRFERKHEMKALVSLFAEHNIQVESRWLDEDISPQSQLSDLTPLYCRSKAEIDLEDIDSADTLVFFSDAIPTTVRGGKHVEFGYALGTCRRIVVIGPHENIFHYLPHVIQYNSVEDFLDAEGIENASVAE